MSADVPMAVVEGDPNIVAGGPNGLGPVPKENGSFAG